MNSWAEFVLHTIRLECRSGSYIYNAWLWDSAIVLIELHGPLNTVFTFHSPVDINARVRPLKNVALFRLTSLSWTVDDHEKISQWFSIAASQGYHRAKSELSGYWDSFRDTQSIHPPVITIPRSSHMSAVQTACLGYGLKQKNMLDADVWY
jgi:hypothetical protein